MKGNNMEMIAYKMIPTKGKESTYEMDELVRCKECKYCYVDGENVRYNVCAMLHNKVQSGDWFCADGIRKDEEHE